MHRPCLHTGCIASFGVLKVFANVQAQVDLHVGCQRRILAARILFTTPSRHCDSQVDCPWSGQFFDLALLTAVFSAKLAAPTQKLRCSSASTSIFCFPALIRTAENEVGEISYSYIIVLNLRLIL